MSYGPEAKRIWFCGRKMSQPFSLCPVPCFLFQLLPKYFTEPKMSIGPGGKQHF